MSQGWRRIVMLAMGSLLWFIFGLFGESDYEGEG
jgi:hypothetical protein